MSILVIGDLIEDKYHFVDVRRVSPEAPCLIGLDVSSETKFGGAANVAMNMSKLRSSVALCGACDESYEHLLQEAGFSGSRLLTGRHSTKHRFVDIKTRMQVFRHDVESINPGDDIQELELYNNFIKGISTALFRLSSEQPNLSIKHETTAVTVSPAPVTSKTSTFLPST